MSIASKGVQLFNSSVLSIMHKKNIFLFNNKIFNKDRMLKRYYRKENTILAETKESNDALGKTNDDPDFSDQLVKWAVQNNINNLAFSKLLKVLTEYGIKGLPKSSHVLLKAKESEIKVSLMPPGIYTHFGFSKNLKTLMLTLIDKNLFSESDISVSVFIDQLPHVKLIHKGLWVILGSVEGFTDNVFFIGAYCGCSKPSSSNLFLSEFVKESKDLCKNGLEVNNVIYNVKIKRLICDVNAKSFVLNIKTHCGYSSCTKCEAVGEYKSHKICFLEKCSPRKDEDYKKNKMYINRKTCLLEIPNFGIVSNVTLDYMHLVCLGVVKKLLSIWLSNDKHWLSNNSTSDLIQKLQLIYPSEFQKKPKPFKAYNQWIASDFREFLLYYGPVVLENNLKEKYYRHFLLLHVACRLLCSEASTENIDYGRQLLNNFVIDYKNLYKTEQITHNFHGLYHLADECISHGTLDNFSAFPFEKFLVRLKTSMERKKKRSIPQTVLRESYDKIFKKDLSYLITDNYRLRKKKKVFEDNQLKDFIHYEKLCFRNFNINPNSEGDNYVLLKNGKIIQVTDILLKKEKTNKHFVAGNEFHSISNFHSKTFKSLKLEMFKIKGLSNSVNFWPVDFIDKKCMKVPTEREGSVMVGFLDKNF